ncbi:sugar phosphate isomerase/epimerase family protein [Rummeliibacillus suwonensis]|uniref:sugar phosphate isomerase/epimerase family protein n=1 Tax=Rummeliibacillus suwonensis TaxID=1306154 RepID=UPI0011B6D182|nr:sugar phosphate isomerase/epimerase [Rummeliibacillus suwonensis]
MKLGLFTRVYQDLEIEEAFPKIMEHGIEYIEVVSNRGSKHLDLDKALTKDYFNNYTNVLQKNSLKISALTIHRDSQLVLGPHGAATQRFYPGSAEEQIEYGIKRAKLAADVAKEYGVSQVIGYLGCQNFSDYYPWPNKDGWDNQLKMAYERWMPILEYYEKQGVVFAHEVGPQQIAYDIETTIRVTELLDSNLLKLCLDPSNMILMGVNPELFIEHLGEKIVNVHGKDAEITYKHPFSGSLPHGDLSRPDRGIRFRIPGWGDVQWKKVLSALKLIGYNQMISIEFEDPIVSEEEGVKKSIDYLKPLLFE